MSLQQRKTSLPSRPINTRIPHNKNVSSQVSNNSSFTSDVSNLSTIRSDSMSSISSTRSDRTLTKPKVSNLSDLDLKKDSSEDLIKKIENLVSRNKILEEENNVLKNLINEDSKISSHCDERRILMLKCQIYQLEKQINVLSKSISFRKLAHTDSFNTLSILTESFRSIIHNSEAKSLTPTKSFNIEKNEFIKWIEIAESAKLKLIKAQNENEYDANSSIESLLFESNFSNKEINILDVCSGNLSHVNLKKIGQLESNMSQLYKNLNRLRESLKTIRNLRNDESKINQFELNNSKKKTDNMLMHNEYLKNQLDESLKKTSEVCRDLFDLSLLVPSAPWGAIKKSPIEDLSENALMNKLKAIGLPKTKHQSVEILLKSLFISSNYHHHMKTQECTALNEELNFYRSCYSVQKSYVESITELFRSNYEQFIRELIENIRDPLKILINKFWLMKEKSTEDNLKEFLSLFKSYTKIFDKVIQSFEFIPNDNVVNTTFDKLMLQIDTEINKLNSTWVSKMEQISLEGNDLKNLTIQSDELLLDYIKPTPLSSPDNSILN